MDDATQRFAYRLGTHRLRTPEETLQRVMPFMSDMGITRIADVTGLDTIGIPVVMVCRPNARSVSVSQGKGHTLAAAQASGLMESIEGFHAENMVQPLHIASAQDMKGAVPLALIEQLPVLKNSRFTPHTPLSWIEADDLLAEQSCWLPYEMVHTNYTYPRPTGSGCFPASSNGLASGNSTAEATVHGLCEVIERDALSRWHQLGSAQLDLTSINPDTIEDEQCMETLCKLDAASQHTCIWDITSDTGVPSYFCTIIDRGSHTQHIGVGSGTHLCREVALLRAMHEAVQVRTTYIVGARDDIRHAEYAAESIDAKRRFFTAMIDECSFTADFSRTTSCHSNFADRDLETLLTHLKSVGVAQVLRIDLQKPEYNIAVVRVVVPGLEAPHDDEDYVPGRRLNHSRQAMRE